MLRRWRLGACEFLPRPRGPRNSEWLELRQYLAILRIAATTPKREDLDLEDADCTVFSPPSIARGRRILVQVLLHSSRTSEDLESLAKESDPAARRRGFQTLQLPVRRGDELSVSLESEFLEIEEPTQVIRWSGETCNLQYSVLAPKHLKLGPCQMKVIVRKGILPIGRILFTVSVVRRLSLSSNADSRPTGDSAHRFRRAFVSTHPKTGLQPCLRRVSSQSSVRNCS